MVFAAATLSAFHFVWASIVSLGMFLSEADSVLASALGLDGFGPGPITLPLAYALANLLALLLWLSLFRRAHRDRRLMRRT